jgi:murein DD-endopeptidase MepM/ murein hydrolase activator NlpD
VITAILPVRQQDAHGDGMWGASRGSRKHTGVDFACFVGTKITSHVIGQCTKIGYPYGDDLSFKYVEVTDAQEKQHRFFYLKPSLKVGDQVDIGTVLGEVQDLERRYSGITPHCHYEIKRHGNYLNPLLEGY